MSDSSPPDKPHDKTKPIDRWLWALGGVMSIFLFLFAKTPLVVILCAVAVFSLLIHPVWNFWWIESYRGRQLFFTTLLAVGCFLIGYGAWPPAPSPDLHGLLIPANDPTPPIPCTNNSGDAIAIFLGNSIALTRQKQTSVIFQRQEAFSISKIEGGMNFSGRFASADNSVIGQITNNEFYINPSNYFRLKRPNWHTLIVEDPEGNQVLYVYYLNASTVKVLGRFYSPNRTPVIVQEDQMTFSGMTLSGGCFETTSPSGIAIYIG